MDYRISAFLPERNWGCGRNEAGSRLARHLFHWRQALGEKSAEDHVKVGEARQLRFLVCF